MLHINCRKLFELLVLSGALAELTWPAILNKRDIFRYLFAFPSVPEPITVAGNLSNLLVWFAGKFSWILTQYWSQN